LLNTPSLVLTTHWISYHISFHWKWQTTATLADGVFVSWTVGPDGKGTSYLKQHIEFFNENNDAMNLMELWAGCIGFVKRRIYDPENPKDDTLMPGKPGVSWGYDAVVNVALSDEDTPSSIGKKIAEQFEKFTEQPGYTGSKQVYKFGGDLTPSDTELQPLSHLLRNDDIVNLFLFLFGDKGKDELFKNEPLLVSFFGDADTAREILSYHAFV